MKIGICVALSVLCLPAQANFITAVSRSGNIALVCSNSPYDEQKSSEVWSLRPWQKVSTIHTDPLRWSDGGNAISPDGRFVAFGCRNSTIEIYDARSGFLQARLGTTQPQGIRSEGTIGPYSVDALAFSPDGKILVSGNPKGVFFWDWHSRKLLFSRPIQGQAETQGHPSGPVRLAHPQDLQFSPNAKILAVAGDEGMPVFLFDLTTRSVSHVLNLEAGDGHANALAFSPDGEQLLVASYWSVAGKTYDQAHLFDTRSGRALWRWNNRDELRFVNSVDRSLAVFFDRAAFSSDGRSFAIGNLRRLTGIAYDHHFHLWSAHPPRLLSSKFSDGEHGLSLEEKLSMVPEFVLP